MDEILARVWESLDNRIGGPLSFRVLLQPIVAASLAIRAGIKDAKQGREPYFWAMLTHPDRRLKRLREGWKAVANVFALAVVMDVAYQVIVFRWVYPIEALFVAFLLAFVPYLLIRGPANRLARLRR
jgi:hypothetical protein